jgi:hypothetical protein
VFTMDVGVEHHTTASLSLPILDSLHHHLRLAPLLTPRVLTGVRAA